MTDEVRKRKRGTEESNGDLNIFEWNIANFTQAFKNISGDESIKSPVFVGKSVDLPNSFWEIEVYPKDEHENAEGKHLGLYLYLSLIKELNHCNPVVKVMSEYFLLDRNQKEVASRKEEAVDEFGAETEVMGFARMASHSDLFNGKKSFLDDDMLRIRIKVWIQNDDENGTTPKRQDCDELHKSFSKLLASPKFSDVEIVAEDLTLKAHKDILSCRSPVFEVMFQNKMSESLTNTVKIEEFSSKTVKGMLEFIYSGSVDSVEEDFMELLKIAEKYELGELKLACTKAAILQISVENAIELLILGDMYNAKELKFRAMAFIHSNKANPLVSVGNEAFHKLAKEHPMLLLELYQNLRNNDVDVHQSGISKETIEEVTRFTTND